MQKQPAFFIQPVLLIWETIPESTEIYYFDRPTNEEFEHMLGANGSYINCDANEHTEWLSEFVCDKKSSGELVPIAVSGSDESTCQSGFPAFVIDKPCCVVISGFVL